jgi:hypothetical protein
MHALLAVDRVVGMAVEDEGFDEGLGALVEFEFDVVARFSSTWSGLPKFARRNPPAAWAASRAVCR